MCKNVDIERGTYCPELWAKDSNAIVCDYAYGRYENGTDLLKSGYAEGAFHIVENQLAKAAWRTAGWLNAIATVYLGDSEYGSAYHIKPNNNHAALQGQGQIALG